MFKYIAVNDFTGVRIKRFLTLKGAQRWYRNPKTFFGHNVNHKSIFINIHKINV